MKTYKARVHKDGDYGRSPQAAALRRQLAGLAALEKTETYQEMCAAATERRRADDALPRQQNGKLLARATAVAAGSGSPSAVGDRPAATGAAQGRGSLGSARPVQAAPTSEATA